MSNYTMPSSYGPAPIVTKLEPAAPLLSFISDDLLSCIVPVIVYWTFSMVFHFMDTHDILDRYRIHTPEEVLKRNHVSRKDVVREVIVQQIVQFATGLALGWTEPPQMTGGEDLLVWKISQRIGWVYSTVLTALGIDAIGLHNKVASYLVTSGGSVGYKLLNTDIKWKLAQVLFYAVIPVIRLGVGIFILDTWQYFWHRLMHQVPFLYRTLHSRHHRLYVPYAYGALYNHPVEGLILDTLGAALAYKVSGMTMKGSIFFFGFCTMKTVDDHCGYKLPYDPLQLLFSNNAEYHDIHHQGWGIKNNFSQPFLICWDRWLGTQYTGGDHALKNQRTRERVHKMIENEKLRQNSPVTSSTDRVREEDDVEYIAAAKIVSSTSTEVTESVPQKRKVRSSRKGSILDGNSVVDVAVKDVADSLRESGKLFNEVVGNVSGAKMR